MAAVQQGNAQPPVAATDAPPPQPKLEGEALIIALTTQLEFYFSRQNLATDAYLLSQMNPQKFVPVDVIANFPKVRSMTEDKSVIIGVMRACKGLSLSDDSTMVKPNLKMARNTLILRDIASSTPEEEVKAIFEAEGCGDVVSIRSDIGDTWFVTFESEDICMDTCMALTSLTFQGKPIRCRVKSENLLRGFYYPTSGGAPGGKPGGPGGGGWRGPPNGYYPAPMGYMGGPGGPPYGNYNNMMPQQYGGQWQPGYPQSGQNTPPNGAPQVGQGQQQQQQRMSGSNERQGTGRGGRGRGEQATVRGKGRKTTTPKSAVVPGSAKAKSRKPVRKGADGQVVGAAPAKAATRTRKGKGNQPPLGPDDFPALPAAPGAKPKATVGYAGEFQTYQRDTMAAVVELMAKNNFEIPSTFPKNENSVINSKPLEDCQLMEPFPVMYPASPSPLFAAQAHHSSDIPFLDLNVHNPYLPPDVPDMSQVVGAGKKSKRDSKRGSQSSSKPSKAVNRSSRPTKEAAKGQPKYAQKPGKRNKNTGAAKSKSGSESRKSATAKGSKQSTAISTSATGSGAPSSNMVWVQVTKNAPKSKSQPARKNSSDKNRSSAPAKAQEAGGPVATRPTAAAIVAGKAKAPGGKVWGKPKGVEKEEESKTAPAVSEKNTAAATEKKAGKKPVKQKKLVKSIKKEAPAASSSTPAEPAKPPTPPSSSTVDKKPATKFSYADMMKKGKAK